MIDRIIPEDRRYTENHQWIRIDDDFIAACGITGYGLELLSGVVFVQPPDPDIEVDQGEQIGIIESVTDLFNIYAPVAGLITAVNSEIEESPDTINSDPYESGWIYMIDVKFMSEYEELMDSGQYLDYIS